MENEDEVMAKEVYDKTALHACMCFDTPAEINKAMSFVCLLMKRGIISFNEPNKTASK